MKKQSKQTQSRKKPNKEETAAGAIVFLIEKGVIKVLLLERSDGWLEIGPKGRVKARESPIRTAHREMQEEIGIPLHIDSSFSETTRYETKDENPRTHKQYGVSKTTTYFLAFLNAHERREIRVSEEHKSFRFVPIDEAVNLVKREVWKQALREAKGYITRYYLT